MIKHNKLYEPCLGRFRKPTTTLNQSEIVRKKMVVPESQPKYPGNSENNQKESQYGEQSFDSKLLDQNRVEKPEFDLSSKVIQKKRREESNPLDLSRNREENPRFGSSGKKAVLRELTNQITKKAVLPIKNNLKHTTKDGSYKPYGNEPRISKQESMDSRRKDVFAELENSFEEIPLAKKPVVRSSLEQLESQASSPRTKKIIQNISSLKNATNPGSLAAHVSDNEEVVLSAEEEKTYGKRFPASYEKLKLIGKGGQAAVWLGSRKSDQQVFAIKQISLTGFVNEKTALKEIELNDIIFKNGSDELLYKLGCRSIIEVVEHFVTSKDIFIVLTLCGDSLSKLIYSIKGEFFKLERIYKITNGGFYKELASNFSLFKKFVSQLLIGLNTLTQKGIVHCDLKPENILIKYDPIERDTKEVKIIDFGASFLFNGTPFLTVTTPEYLPPEFLQLFAGKKAMNNKQKHDILLKKSLPWSIDVWSLGIIIIEIMLGVPVWMSFKCRTTLNNKETIMMGLFSSTSRDNEKIADKMVKFVPVMRKKMRDLIGFYPQFDAVLDLLEKMLALDPLKRPGPKELLGHPFFVL